MAEAEQKETKWAPLGNRAMVRIDPREESRSTGGIIIPVGGNADLGTATVLAVGPGEQIPGGTFVEPRMKPGDRVMMWRQDGWVVDVRNDVRLVDAAKILAVEAANG